MCVRAHPSFCVSAHEKKNESEREGEGGGGVDGSERGQRPVAALI